MVFFKLFLLQYISTNDVAGYLDLIKSAVLMFSPHQIHFIMNL